MSSLLHANRLLAIQPREQRQHFKTGARSLRNNDPKLE